MTHRQAGDPAARVNTPAACPCGSGLTYAGCCGGYLDGETLPVTAEQLMRSRYTAYSRGREQYLLDSWHRSTRPDRLNLAQDSRTRWIGLQILKTEAGSALDSEGIVAFVARCKVNGKAQRLYEVSRFVRENGRWYYLDGVAQPDK